MADIANALLVAGTCGVAVVIPIWSHRVQRQFYLAYRQAFGPQPRQRPWVRWGEGLDDEAFGSWDFVPAWHVLNVPIDDLRLDRERRLARRAGAVEFFSLFVIGLLGVVVIGGLLTGSILLGILPVVAYFGGQFWSSSGALWLSRPDLEDRQRLGERAYQTTITVVAALLILAFGLALLLIQLTGRAAG